ncbi:hypothetical protein J6590_045296 [Homalodisca vitripennis]|nr:hypothetical protein J6590_045296 [Homalodisca vitripennis]
MARRMKLNTFLTHKHTLFAYVIFLEEIKDSLGLWYSQKTRSPRLSSMARRTKSNNKSLFLKCTLFAGVNVPRRGSGQPRSTVFTEASLPPACRLWLGGRNRIIVTFCFELSEPLFYHSHTPIHCSASFISAIKCIFYR